MTDRNETALGSGLIRAIGRWDLVAILINTVIGAGILGLPAKTFGLVGSYSIAAWLLCAAIMGIVALCFAEVGCRFRETGGPYLYAHAAFGPAAGFTIGWLTWVSRLFSYSAICNLAVNYAAGIFPGLADGMPRLAAITAITALLTIFLLMGIRRSTAVNNIFTACKLVLLFGFVLIALPHADFANFSAPSHVALSDWRAAILLMTFAFVGVESGLINTGEMKTPHYDVPFALGVGLGVIALLYVMIQVASIGVLPDLAASQRPVVEAAEQILGPAGGAVVNIGALITMAGTLFAVLLTGSRLPFAFAEQGQLPQILGAVHPRLKTPYVAILVTTGLAWVITMNSSFFAALTMTAATRLLGYAVTCAALVVLRRRQPDAGSAHYKAPAGPVVAVVGVIACLWLLLAITQAELLTILTIAAVGMLFGGIYAMLRRKRALAS